ncbi:tectonic-1-like [Schistocerca gregaria]|uniref:tectonic-1-like n=1 Tax=Schistocerca gregaria TaxID=7010 RepID=UPI00211EF61A|nr:tectonic-1-like [Schistocerca gregaria]
MVFLNTLLHLLTFSLCLFRPIEMQDLLSFPTNYLSYQHSEICNNNETLCTTEILGLGTNESDVNSTLTIVSKNFEDDDHNLTLNNVTQVENHTLPVTLENTLLVSEPSSSKSTESSYVAVTTSVLPVSEKPRWIPEENCACDLELNSCDINCCCDADCSEEDRLVFLRCEEKPSLSPDPQYCYRTQFIYKNNTKYKLTTTSNGLFCIVKENLPKDLKYMEGKVVTNIEDFKNALPVRNTYPWPENFANHSVFNFSGNYKAADIIWTFHNSTMHPLSFPTKLTNEYCQVTHSLQYLREWSGHCTRIVSSCDADDGLSAAWYYKHFSILADPLSVNQSHLDTFLESCPNNTCLQIIPFFCDGTSTDMDECVEGDEIETPSLDNDMIRCTNVVQTVKYVVHHNGSEGILKMEAFFWLINITLTEQVFTQDFEILFTWFGKQRKPFQRSGRPGYIFGKPIMAGKKVFQPSAQEQEPDREAIMLSDDPLGWLTIARPLPDGSCGLVHEYASRSIVTFGENQRTSCVMYLHLSDFSNMTSCTSIQRKVFHIMLGNNAENITELQLFNFYVATFGDSSVEDTGDWVPILFENIPQYESSLDRNGNVFKCRNIITTFHTSILYSYTGSVLNPQAKIVGTSFRFGTPHDLIYRCLHPGCEQIQQLSRKQIQIVSSVSFYDVSSEPELYFSKPPVYEVKLPFDFFYPFLSNRQSTNVVNYTKILSIYFFLFITHTFAYNILFEVN